MTFKGSVTVFTAMVFLLVAAVITTSIQSARMHAAKVMVGTSLSLAMDSTFADYDRTLFEKWGILLYDGADEKGTLDEIAITDKTLTYLKNNIDTNAGLYFSGGNDLYGIEIRGIRTMDVKTATDDGGVLWMESVVDYEKYAKVISLIAEFMDIDASVDTTIDHATVATMAYECINKMKLINDKVKNLVQYIDGIQMNEEGINPVHLEFVPACAKSFLPNYDYEKLGVERNDIAQQIYRQIKSTNEDPMQLIEDAMGATQKGNLVEANRKLAKLESMSKDTSETIEGLLKLMDSEISTTEKLSETVDNLCEYLEENAESFGETFTAEMTESIGEMGDYNEILAEDVIDIENAVIVMSQNQAILEEIVDKIAEYGSSSNRVGVLEELKELTQRYSCETVRIRYDGLLRNPNGSDSWFASLAKYVQYGPLSISLPDDAEVSDKQFHMNSLASTYVDPAVASSIASRVDEDTLIAKRVIYDEYVMDHFHSFVDNQEGAVLNYEVEYNLYGQDTDQMNLAYAVDEICTIRTMLALAYISTDEEKKTTAHEYAQMMVEWTENEAIVRFVYYLLLFLWSCTESYSDAKILLSGGKIDLVKNEDNWQSTIDEVFSLHVNPDVDACQTGLDYEAFLRAFLLIENDGRRSGYTMDLIEGWMVASGRKDFRMKTYIYSMCVDALYTIRGGFAEENYSIGYSY